MRKSDGIKLCQGGGADIDRSGGAETKEGPWGPDANYYEDAWLFEAPPLDLGQISTLTLEWDACRSRETVPRHKSLV